MNQHLCIIAIHADDRYYSVRCYGDDQDKVLARLQRQATSNGSARRLISQGDFCIAQTEDQNTERHPPVVHTSPIALAIYAVDVQADAIHVYEQYAWGSVALSHAVAEEALACA